MTDTPKCPRCGAPDAQKRPSAIYSHWYGCGSHKTHDGRFTQSRPCQQRALLLTTTRGTAAEE